MLIVTVIFLFPKVTDCICSVAQRKPKPHVRKSKFQELLEIDVRFIDGVYGGTSDKLEFVT